MSGRGSGRKRKAPPTGSKQSRKAAKEEKVEKEREKGYDGSTESDGDGVEQGSGEGTLYVVVGVTMFRCCIVLLQTVRGVSRT